MTISLNGITLPADLDWIDEFAWTPIRQRRETTLSGAQVVEDSAQAKGRPITLEGGENAAWVTRATAEALFALVGVPGAVYVLDYHGRTFNTMFDQARGPIQSRPVQRLADHGSDHFYTLTLRLFEV